ncbi:hypothetical protein M9H77_04826 [Catharanthus roseus]|uniref:Uncharacterized protein n=1 Tax=Catharanthus roseus TaxID=4058 RepID=A0ACC0CFL6_CATRO|nr:hypothetical protein M9H77_04826 [Catharanthus roseus]
MTLDERTSCMKPDLHLALNTTAIENNGTKKSESGNFQLRKAFRARLCDFFKAHPEVKMFHHGLYTSILIVAAIMGDDIPEEVLPEPFNQSKKFLEINLPRASGSSFASQKQPAAPSEQQISIVASYLPPFRRRFSQQAAVIPVSEPCSPLKTSRNRTCVSADTSPVQFSSNPASNVDCLSDEASLAKLPVSPPPETPVKAFDCCHVLDPSSDGTPAPSACTPAKLMSATPTLRENKRCCMSPDDDSTQSPNKLISRPSRSGSLKFDTPVKRAIENDVEEGEHLSVSNDILDILPDNLIQLIRQKERKALSEQDPAISQAKWRQ